jgi:putative oxidoreductase
LIPKLIAIFLKLLSNFEMFEFILKVHSYLVKTCQFLQSPFLLVVRLVWGYKFFEAGFGKFKIMPKVVSSFGEMNIPFPEFSVYLAAGTECVGGILLMLGLFSRITCIPLAFTMFVAYITAHQEAVQSLLKGDSEPFLNADPFLYLFASLLILIFGPGALSLDRIIDALFIKGKKGRS